MKKIFFYITLIPVLNTISCARIGSPNGGSKDSIPPVMVIAKPANKTTSFKKDKIVISFDEYIKIQKLNTQLIISPPIEKRPIIKPQKGVSKKISIQFLDSLKANTTYTINFGNSIVDNNEGNELGKLSYVFSTGPKLDSLFVMGNITDPLSNKQIENISVMAYKNANDTLIGNYIPDYLTNTLKSNHYILENLAEADYKIIALEDKNNNYKYDKGIERIAFLNRSIKLSSKKDSINFTLFKEPKNFKIYKPKQTKGNQLILGYEGNSVPKLKIEGTDKNNYLISQKQNKDSLYIWFKKIPLDSIQITAKLDTLVKKYTLKLRELEKDTMLISSSLNNILHPNDSLILTTNIPVNYINLDSIQLLENDSIAIPFKIISQPTKHKLYANFDRQINKTYTLNFKKAAFTDFLTNSNTAKKIQVSTLDAEEYGELVLNIQNPLNYNLIIELLEKTSSKKMTSYITKSNIVRFKNLEAKLYKVRIIKDLNKNNKFDNGFFLQKRQPEPVTNYSKTLKIRANSKINENISIN